MSPLIDANIDTNFDTNRHERCCHLWRFTQRQMAEIWRGTDCCIEKDVICRQCQTIDSPFAAVPRYINRLQWKKAIWKHQTTICWLMNVKAIWLYCYNVCMQSKIKINQIMLVSGWPAMEYCATTWLPLRLSSFIGPKTSIKVSSES